MKLLSKLFYFLHLLHVTFEQIQNITSEDCNITTTQQIFGTQTSKAYGPININSLSSIDVTTCNILGIIVVVGLSYVFQNGTATSYSGGCSGNTQQQISLSNTEIIGIKFSTSSTVTFHFNCLQFQLYNYVTQTYSSTPLMGDNTKCQNTLNNNTMNSQFFQLNSISWSIGSYLGIVYIPSLTFDYSNQYCSMKTTSIITITSSTTPFKTTKSQENTSLASTTTPINSSKSIITSAITGNTSIASTTTPINSSTSIITSAITDNTSFASTTTLINSSTSIITSAIIDSSSISSTSITSDSPTSIFISGITNNTSTASTTRINNSSTSILTTNNSIAISSHTWSSWYTKKCFLKKFRSYNNTVIEMVEIEITDLNSCDLLDVSYGTVLLKMRKNQTATEIDRLNQDLTLRLNDIATNSYTVKTIATGLYWLAILMIMSIFLLTFLSDLHSLLSTSFRKTVTLSKKNKVSSSSSDSKGLGSIQKCPKSKTKFKL